jgi:hypothetical protein
MTSSATFGGATTASRYFLYFNGSGLGSWLEKYTSQVRRADPIQVRHNLWANNARLDGSFPAKVWEHDLTIYSESTSMSTFIDFWNNLSDNYLGDSAGLVVMDMLPTVATTFVAFGNCYLAEPPQLSEPDALLKFAAGFITLKFIGNTKPVVTP